MYTLLIAQVVGAPNLSVLQRSTIVGLYYKRNEDDFLDILVIKIKPK